MRATLFIRERSVKCILQGGLGWRVLFALTLEIQMAKSRRSTEKRDFWQMVFQEYQISGLSIRAFCEREGLPEPSFYAWRKRLAANEKVSPATAAVAVDRLIPVRIVAEDQSQHVVKQASAPMEIRTPSGYTLRLDESVEIRRLSELLCALASVQGETASC
jgi:hypothetical protein